MKKALITMMCLAAMFVAGTGLKAQEIPITLAPGCNWISYPNAEAMPIVEALGSFTPENGDIIQSQFDSYCCYLDGSWRGDLTQFVPGLGYKYYSARTEEVEFVFAQPASNVVTTDEPTDITLTSAVVGGKVTLPEGSQVFLRGVCWGTEPRPDIDGDHTTEETGIGSFSNTLEDLNPNTTYYVRAYVIYDHGLAYGNELSFTTLSGIPVVTTAEVTDVTATTATCGGTVTDDGGLDITARGVCWSTSPTPTIVDAHSTDGTGTGNFSSTLTGLTPNTTYFVRAYATNSYVTVYGNQRSFTTAPLPNCTVSVTCNPTEGGTITGGGTYEQGQSCTLTATANEGYTFTNWTENGSQVSTNATYTFTVNADRTLVANFTYNGGGDHAYVDLGLPSGLLWATCNVGADNPEDYGDYFAWGETQPKDYYNWSTYQYCNGNYNTLTKYCNDSYNGYNGFTDNLTTLLPEDDAATANWGSDWRMPTQAEWQELYQNTTHTWTTQNGVNGRLFTAPNGNSLFLPAAGYRDYSSLDGAGSDGGFWSSSLYTDLPDNAWGFYFFSGNFSVSGSDRYYGLSVRGVRSASQNNSFSIDAASNPDEGGTVTGAGTYDEGSTCILMAIANEGYTFINWTENGVEVSAQATYSFTVTSNRNLVANFVPNSGVPIGAVNGRFTINEEGDQVYFSQGNLQYTKSTQTWSFMEHQYDVIVTEGQDVGDDYANTDIVSHFCWGTSGYNLRGTETDYYYQPFNTYQESGDAYGPSGSHNLTGDYANGDWGVYNAISNGGNVDNYWRTLTRDEWYYLFTGRDDALSKWERGNIDGVNGVILLPDDWELPEGLTFNVIDESDYEANTYTLQQWETMQAAGAVFLPASGWRRGTEVSEVNNLVGYWSSTYEYGFSAHNIWIENYGSSSHTVFNDGSYRYRGYAVRLVRDAGIVSYSIDAAPSPTEGGTVTGTGTFNEGASCTLTAMPNEGYTFVNWTENGEVVSTNATYSFTVNADRTLVANFIQSGSGGDAPTGAIDGKFTINADGNQVYFSQGNLQYIGSAATPYWKFADNQWDVLNTATGQNSSSQNVDRDLFGWGTSGYNHGANCYQPWSTSQSNSDYHAYGSPQYNLYDQTGQADWGYNPISNGGNQANQWRTLTQPEWAYIFNTRTTSSGIRYAKATVNDVNGVILLPDDWSSDTYSLVSINYDNGSYYRNTISATQWSTLEQAGAVFLPAAGYRGGTSVYNVGAYGRYWSASYDNSIGAYLVDFDSGYLDPSYNSGRVNGQSVRLVAPAEN